ncbi:hypothetical protein MBANPS3_005015 [Mucor bainieri]
MISAKKGLCLSLFFILNTIALVYIYKNYKHDILEGIQNLAVRMRSIPYSPLIMTLLICLCANPPMLGHTFCITMCGYIYGFSLKGCLPAVLGTFFGCLLTFVLVRKLNLGRLIRRVSSGGKQETFDAMSRAISQGGFKIAFLIRLCPLPWQVSSSVLSLCDTVSYKTYCLATLLGSFKTSLEVWIGSQLATLTDATLPPEAHKVAMITMGIGLVVLITVAVWLYRLTMDKIKEMQQDDIYVVVNEEDQMALLDYEEEQDDELQSPLVKVSTFV